MADRKKPGELSFNLDLFPIVAIIFVVLIAREIWTSGNREKAVPYSEYLQWMAKGAVSDVVIGQTTITGTYTPPGKNSQPEPFTTQRVDSQTSAELEKRHIQFTGQPEPGMLESLIAWLLPALGLVLLWMFLLRPMMPGVGGGLMGVGRSRAKVFAETDIKTTFADVEILERNRGVLETGAATLLAHESLGQAELAALKDQLVKNAPSHRLSAA